MTKRPWKPLRTFESFWESIWLRDAGKRNKTLFDQFICQRFHFLGVERRQQYTIFLWSWKISIYIIVILSTRYFQVLYVICNPLQLTTTAISWILIRVLTISLTNRNPLKRDCQVWNFHAWIAISAMDVAFLKLWKVIIWRSYLPLSQLDSRRGFWQAILRFRESKTPRLARYFLLWSPQFQKSWKGDILQPIIDDW